MALMLICSVSWPEPCALYPAERLFGMCSCGSSSRARSHMPTPPLRPEPDSLYRALTSQEELLAIAERRTLTAALEPFQIDLCRTLKRCCGHVRVLASRLTS